MLKYLNQNKHVILIAVALFVVSVSTLLFFLGANPEVQKHEVKADFLEGINVKSLQEDESHYRKLTNNLEDPILVLALDGSIEFVSRDVESKWSYVKKDIVHQSFFVLLHPDDLPDFLGVFGKVLQTEQPVNTIGPYRIRAKNGEYRMIIGLAAPLIEKGKVQKIVIAAKDITSELSEKSDEGNTKKQNNHLKKNREKSRPANPKGKPIRDEKQPVDGRIIADK